MQFRIMQPLLNLNLLHVEYEKESSSWCCCTHSKFWWHFCSILTRSQPMCFSFSWPSYFILVAWPFHHWSLDIDNEQKMQILSSLRFNPSFQIIQGSKKARLRPKVFVKETVKKSRKCVNKFDLQGFFSQLNDW